MLSRVCVRFLFVYLGLCFLPLPHGFRDSFVNFLSAKLLKTRFDLSTADFGSADRAVDYAWAFFNLIFSGLVASIWSMRDKRAKVNHWILTWGILALRFAIASVMISYGVIKILPVQFPAPSLIRLLEPYGNSSPMALFWTFIGASKTYRIFSGAVELICGLLLLLSNTYILGAVIAVGVALQVLMLNLSYDVPVKLFSFHLFFASLILVATRTRPLYQFFFKRQSASLSADSLYFKDQFLNRVMKIMPIAVGMCMLCLKLSVINKREVSLPVPLYGVWFIEKVEGVEDFPWTQVVFELPTLMAAQEKNGDIELIKIEAMDEYKFITLRNRSTGWKVTFDIDKVDPHALNLYGKWGDKKVALHLKKRDPSGFLLLNRGFHFVSEYPFNE